MHCYTWICHCLFNRNCYLAKNRYRSILILILVADGHISIYNGFKKLYSSSTLEEIEEIVECFQELEIWQCVTDLQKKKQDPVEYLSLTDKIRKSCNYILVRDLNKDDRLDTIIRKIKSLYAKDTNTLGFMAYDKFDNFKRPDDMNIANYISVFERLNNQIKHLDIEIATGVLVYKVLRNANKSNEKQQLIRATIVTLTYDNMKWQSKAIFDSSPISTTSESIDVKSEPAFYVNKGTDGRYQDSKDCNRNGTSQYPRVGYRSNSCNFLFY